MPTVELSFSALPTHVRTARLVAVAVARRTGVDESVLDEMRLAVGEACSRAVELHRRHCPVEPVAVSLSDGGGSFVITVTDQVPVAPSSADEVLEAFADDVELEHDALPSEVGLAVIAGLVEDLVVEPTATGAALRMTWPTPAATA